MKRTFVLPTLVLATVSLGTFSSCGNSNPVTSIEAIAKKTDFKVGDHISKEDVTVNLIYRDNTKKETTNFHFEMGQTSYYFDLDDLGEKKLTVYASSKAADFTVNVTADPTYEKLKFTDFSTEAPFTCTVTRLNDNIQGYVIIPETYQKEDSNTIYTVTKIADDAFKSCTKLSGVYLPKTLKTIGNSSFSNMSKTVYVEGPTIIMKHCTQLERIGSDSFRSLNYIPELPNSLKYIGSYAFYYSRDFIPKLPESLISIGAYAFSFSNSSSTLTIPKNVTSIGEGAFDMSTPHKVYIDSPTIAETASNSSKVFGSEVAVNSTISVKSSSYIGMHYQLSGSEGNYKTYGLRSLVFNIIDQTNKYCEVSAGNCSGDVTIPSTTTIDGVTYTVTKIASRGFVDASSVTAIHIPSTIKTIARSFDYGYSLYSLKNAYFESTEGWSAGSNPLDRYDLEKPAVAAVYLADTYSSYTWTQA